MSQLHILPLFYAGSIGYFKELLAPNAEILIEKQENFPKQTHRNRMFIYGANGKLDLIIPVQKGRGEHTLYKDVKISYDNPWQRVHWLSLTSAYRRSAYFEFYEDAFAPFYNQKINFLFDFNEQMLHTILKCLKIDMQYGYTTDYQKFYSESVIDFRLYNPYRTVLSQTSYYQIFADKHGFLPNLSVLDALFNLGPATSKLILI